MARESKRKRDERRFGSPVLVVDHATASDPDRWDWSKPVYRGWSPDEIERLKGDAARLQGSLRDCKVFDVTAASRLYWDNAKDSWGNGDFPNVAPPFSSFFVEMANPGTYVSGGERLSADGDFPDRWGVHVVAFDCDGREPDIDAPDLRGAELPGCRWGCLLRLLVAHKGSVHLAPAMELLTIDGRGRIMKERSLMGGPMDDGIGLAAFVDLWRCMVNPALFSMAFLHCKNVEIKVVNRDREVNRERRKEGLKPFVRYHLIDIEPMKEVLRTEGQMESLGLQKALHMVRGHFATYTEENRLFGRLTGTFWVPAHLRGSIKEGIVVADYRVCKPC